MKDSPPSLCQKGGGRYRFPSIFIQSPEYAISIALPAKIQFYHSSREASATFASDRSLTVYNACDEHVVGTQGKGDANFYVFACMGYQNHV
jgi:hypothetical protein